MLFDPNAMPEMKKKPAPKAKSTFPKPKKKPRRGK